MIIQSVLSISNKGRLQAPQFKGRSPIKIRKRGGGENLILFSKSGRGVRSLLFEFNEFYLRCEFNEIVFTDGVGMHLSRTAHESQFIS